MKRRLAIVMLCGAISEFCTFAQSVPHAQVDVKSARAKTANQRVVTPTTPRFAYLLSGDKTITCYSIDAVTGRLNGLGYQVLETAGNPTALAVTSSSRFLYVVDSTSKTVSGYSIGANGILTPVPKSAFPVGAQPTAVAIDPTDSYVYVSDAAGGNVSGFSIDSVGGALTRIPGSPFPAGVSPQALNIDPSGKFVYVANSGVSLKGDPPARFDENERIKRSPDTVSAFFIASDGSLKPIAGSPYSVGSHPDSITITSSGQYLYVANTGSGDVSAFGIDKANGTLRPLRGSPFKAGPVPQTIVTDSTGACAYVSDNQNGVYGFRIGSDGSLTPMSGSPYKAGSGSRALAIDQSNRFLYTANFLNDTISVFARDQSDGAITLRSTMLSHSSPGAIKIASGTKPVSFVPAFAYVGNFGNADTTGTLSAYKIDPLDGALSVAGGSPYPNGPHSEIATATHLGSSFVYLPFGGKTIGSARVQGWIRAVDGSLSLMSGSPLDLGFDAWTLYVLPSNKFAYAVDYTDHQLRGYSIDPTNGRPTAVTGAFPLEDNPVSLSSDATGKFLYVGIGPLFSNGLIAVYAVNPISGTLIRISTANAGGIPASIAVHPSGLFVYVSNQAAPGSLTAYTVNPSNGNLVEMPGSPYSGTVHNPVNLAIEPTGRFLYAANLSSNDVTAFSINQASGALTQITGSPFATGKAPYSISIEQSGAYVYVTDFISGDISAFVINSQTGALTAATGSPFPSPKARSVVTINNVQ